MKDFKDKNVNERLQNAARAKQAMLERARAMPGANDPAVIEQLAARREMEAAREARAAARAEAKAREETERAALAILEEQKAAEQKAAMEAEQKAQRDARYAARKQRKK